MTESFAELFDQSLKHTEMKNGELITGTVLEVANDYVLVNVGLKTEAMIPIDEFKNKNGEIDVEVGSQTEVELENAADGFGETILSHEKALLQQAWRNLKVNMENNETITGFLTGKVRGGFTIELEHITAFLPGSLVDIRPVRDISYLEGKELQFKVIKIDQERNNVVLSRRAVLLEESNEEREDLLNSLEKDAIVKGIVKNLTDYGAFIDLGGIDGLLHITDLAWKRVNHPSEVLTIGDEIEVKVLNFEKETNRVALGIKQLSGDPWENIGRRYPSGTRVFGKVINMADYGAFIEIEEGVEGLVHTSEMDWTNKNVHPSKVVSLGDEVEVMILEINEERRRISLGMKQCIANPWELFAALNKKEDRVVGNIRSITDFGIFIGLEGGIDGLVHLSDISWNEPGEVAIKNYSKGQEVETVILSIDAERERISLGIKQISREPFLIFIEKNPKGSIIKGKVSSVEPNLVTVDVADDVQGLLKVSEISQERVESASDVFAVGDDVEAMFVSIDRKLRALNLSIKAKDVKEEKQALEHFNKEDNNTSNTSIGSLIKEKLHND